MELQAQQQEVIQKTVDFLKQKFEKEPSGHEWWHLYRVWQNAKHIGKSYPQANMYIVQLAALLHDIADWKFSGDFYASSKAAAEWLRPLNVSEEVISEIGVIIDNVSFKGAAEAKMKVSIEGQIVQDADRLDALGAIGISRALTYGGYKQIPLYVPDKKPKLNMSMAEYKNHTDGSTINHFYEKLLLLKDLLHTDAARSIAEARHKYMQGFLDQFFKEWEGKA